MFQSILSNMTLDTHTSYPVVVHHDSLSWQGNLRLLTNDLEKHESFADSNSTCSSRTLSTLAEETNIIYSNKDEGLFSLFQVGDGSAEDPDGIPKRFLDMCGGDRSAALDALEKTIDWREENGINDILNKPHVNYDICKEVVPHIFVGRDVDGHAVYVQQPALLDLEKVKRNGLDFDDLLSHSIYIQEYLWQIEEADNAMATITSIIDVGDYSFSQFRSHFKENGVVQFCKNFAKTFDDHFPMRAHKTLIINAPKWFHLLYRFFKSLMRASSTAKIEICTRGKKQDDTLKALLGPDASKMLPDYCWSKPSKRSSWSPSKLEKDLDQFVLSRIKASGKTMKPVL